MFGLGSAWVPAGELSTPSDSHLAVVVHEITSIFRMKLVLNAWILCSCSIYMDLLVLQCCGCCLIGTGEGCCGNT